MKTLAIALLASSLLAFSPLCAHAADTATGAPQTAVTAKKPHLDFADAKALKLKHIDAHIAKLQKARDCINAATDAAALKACNPKKHHGKHRMHAEENAVPVQ